MLLKIDFLTCAPSPAEVVACELKAIRADSKEHDCMGCTAASRPIVAAATRLIGEAIYTRCNASRLPQAECTKLRFLQKLTRRGPLRHGNTI